MGKYYIHGNVLTNNPELADDNWSAVHMVGKQEQQNIKLHHEIPMWGSIRTPDAKEAYEKVLAYAGSALVRDEVDQRIIRETATGRATYEGKNSNNGKGGEWKSVNYPRKGIIDSQQDTNLGSDKTSFDAWPLLHIGEPVLDMDRDGIPDGWLERNYPAKKASDKNEEGYTYLEVYLNSLVSHITNGQI